MEWLQKAIQRLVDWLEQLFDEKDRKNRVATGYTENKDTLR